MRCHQGCTEGPRARPSHSAPPPEDATKHGATTAPPGAQDRNSMAAGHGGSRLRPQCV